MHHFFRLAFFLQVHFCGLHWLLNHIKDVKWECTLFVINNLWVEFKENMLQQDDGITSVNMLHFEKVEVIKKDGLVTKHLKQISTSANLSFIIDFIDKGFIKIIQHRN